MEWKHKTLHAKARPHDTLKPSLVEWKLETWDDTMKTYVVLETFLGGMETLPPWPRKSKRRRPLETFLSGMETG